MELTKDLLKQFVLDTKKDFSDIIEYLKLDLQEDKDGKFIYITLIKIRKSKIDKGFGSIIMSRIIDFALLYNIRIKLWATCIYGSNLLRLVEFYKRFGFKSYNKIRVEEMIYKPRKPASSRGQRIPHS